MDRRDFLRLAGGASAAVVVGPGCASVGTGPKRAAADLTIWRFSRNQEIARRFLADLPDLPRMVSHDDRAKPPDAYALLAETSDWSTNLGQPGYDNAAIGEIFDQYLIPKMFAAAARGEMTAEEAVKAAEAEMQPIFAKWKERGKI